MKKSVCILLSAVGGYAYCDLSQSEILTKVMKSKSVRTYWHEDVRPRICVAMQVAGKKTLYSLDTRKGIFSRVGKEFKPRFDIAISHASAKKVVGTLRFDIEGVRGKFVLTLKTQQWETVVDVGEV